MVLTPSCRDLDLPADNPLDLVWKGVRFGSRGPHQSSRVQWGVTVGKELKEEEAQSESKRVGRGDLVHSKGGSVRIPCSAVRPNI